MVDPLQNNIGNQKEWLTLFIGTMSGVKSGLRSSGDVQNLGEVVFNSHFELASTGKSQTNQVSLGQVTNTNRREKGNNTDPVSHEDLHLRRKLPGKQK